MTAQARKTLSKVEKSPELTAPLTRSQEMVWKKSGVGSSS
jgi:hypothetical protein